MLQIDITVYLNSGGKQYQMTFLLVLFITYKENNRMSNKFLQKYFDTFGFENITEEELDSELKRYTDSGADKKTKRQSASLQNFSLVMA